MINELIFRGTPREIGVQHGKCLASDIKAVLNHYLSLWTFPQEQIPQRVLGFKRAIEREFPHLGEEIRGIAEGSGLSEDLIYAIKYLAEDSGKKCLSFGARDHIGREVIDAHKDGIIEQIFYTEDFEYRLNMHRHRR